MNRRLFFAALFGAALGQKLLPAAVHDGEEKDPVEPLGTFAFAPGDRLIGYATDRGYALYALNWVRLRVRSDYPERDGIWEVRHISLEDPLRRSRRIGASNCRELAELIATNHFERTYPRAAARSLLLGRDRRDHLECAQ